MSKEIIEVDYGISSAYDEGIEINRKLDGSLREKILKHELEHTDGKYSFKDYKTDFHSKDPYFLESVKFCLKNPEGFIGFFPIMYSYHFKALTINSTAFFPFFLWGIIFSILSWVTLKVNFIYGFLTWTWIFALINIFLLIYTHLYVKHKFKGLKGLALASKYEISTNLGKLNPISRNRKLTNREEVS